MIGIQLVTGYALPVSGPLSLAQAKEHLRIVGTSEDSLITGYLWAAIKYVEEATARALLPSTWRQRLDRFPLASIDAPWRQAGDRWPGVAAYPGWASGSIQLLRNPAIALTALSYLDNAGTAQMVDVATLLLAADQEPARVSPAPATSWPINVLPRPGAVSITYTAGYATNTDIPAYIVQAAYLMLGHWYENREAVAVGVVPAVIPMAAEALINLAAVPWQDFEV